MARYTGPMTKKSRRLGVDLVGGDAAYERRPYPPGQHGRGRIKESEYLLQLREKQKARYTYGVLEKQFHNYYTEAIRRSGKTGDNLLQLLECRLDNVVYRAGFARTRRHARQLVVHGHFMVNGHKVDIPSFQVTRPRRDRRSREVARDDAVHRGSRDPRRARRAGLARGDPDADADPRPPAPGPGPDRRPGPGAAHRRVLLEEVSTPPQFRHRPHRMIRARQIAGGPGKERTSAHRTAPHPVGRVRRRVPFAVRHRAPRARLRLHARQLAAPYPAVLDPRCLGHEHQGRQRPPRVLDHRGRQGGRHRDDPQPQGPRRLLRARRAGHHVPPQVGCR